MSAGRGSGGASLLTIAGLAIGTGGLVGQFIFFQPLFRQMGLSLTGSFFGYFLYFTVLSNLMVITVYWSELAGPKNAVSRFFSGHGVRTAVAAYICLVGLVYTVALRGQIPMTLAMQVSDALVHYVAPPLYAVWWWLAPDRTRLTYTRVPRWLIWPVCYLAIVILFGALTGRFIYPILDPALLGWPAVVVNSAGILALTAMLCAAFVWLNHVRMRR